MNTPNVGTPRRDWYCQWTYRNGTKTSGTFSGMTREEVEQIIIEQGHPDDPYTITEIK